LSFHTFNVLTSNRESTVRSTIFFYWLDWEAGSGKTFLVNGVNFMEYISQQKEDHVNQLEAERIAREQVRNSA
jgi:hypothetical protein